MHDTRHLSHDDVRRILDAVLDHAQATAGTPIAVTVADADGDPIAFVRMDGVQHLSRSMATRKAYTSARAATDSGTYGTFMRQAGIDLKDLDPQMTGFEGGVCLRADGVVVGAIGVSGRMPQEDEELARVGAAAIGLADAPTGSAG